MAKELCPVEILVLTQSTVVDFRSQLKILFCPKDAGEFEGHMIIAPEENQPLTFRPLKTVVRGIGEAANVVGNWQ